jgi:hypothetical protein
VVAIVSRKGVETHIVDWLIYLARVWKANFGSSKCSLDVFEYDLHRLDVSDAGFLMPRKNHAANAAPIIEDPGTRVSSFTN